MHIASRFTGSGRGDARAQFIARCMVLPDPPHVPITFSPSTIATRPKKVLH